MKKIKWFLLIKDIIVYYIYSIGITCVIYTHEILNHKPIPEEACNYSFFFSLTNVWFMVFIIYFVCITLISIFENKNCKYIKNKD